MKKTLLSLATLAALLATPSTLAAKGQGYMGLGYGEISLDEYSSSTVSLDMGARFGETFKQGIGIKYIFMLDEWDGLDTTGIGDIYYKIGYEFFKDFILSANIGFGFEDVGTIGSGSNQTTVFATGITYGGDLTYRLTQHIDITAEYKKMDLSYDLYGVDYEHNYDYISGYIGYRF